MPIPALKDAANDFSLHGPPLSIYLHLLHDVLDVQEFRPVKQLALASKLGCGLRTVERSMSILVQRKYIERGTVGVGEARTYRLVYSRLPDPDLQ